MTMRPIKEEWSFIRNNAVATKMLESSSSNQRKRLFLYLFLLLGMFYCFDAVVVTEMPLSCCKGVILHRSLHRHAYSMFQFINRIRFESLISNLLVVCFSMARQKAAEASNGSQRRFTRASNRVKKQKKPSDGVLPRKQIPLQHKRLQELPDPLLGDLYPEKYPDLDFYQSYGSFLTRKNPISAVVDAEIAEYWALLSTTPTLLQQYIPTLSDSYRSAFRKFFNTDPISLHGHISDAANPFLLTSLLMHLTQHATNKGDFFYSGRKIGLTSNLQLRMGRMELGLGHWRGNLRFRLLESWGMGGGLS